MENLESLKSKLVQIIQECSDQKILLKIWEALNSGNISLVSEPQSIYESEKPMTDQEVEEYFKDEVIELPPHVLEMVKKGLEDIKHGRVISDEDLRKLDEEWMN